MLIYSKFFFSISILESKIDLTCWQTITEERNTYCLIAREKELYKILQGENVYSMQTVSFEKEFKSIIAMSISYNHKFLALYTNNGIIWMGTSDLQTKYCEFDTGRKEKPKQIEWFAKQTKIHLNKNKFDYKKKLLQDFRC